MLNYKIQVSLRSLNSYPTGRTAGLLQSGMLLQLIDFLCTLHFIQMRDNLKLFQSSGLLHSDISNVNTPAFINREIQEGEFNKSAISPEFKPLDQFGGITINQAIVNAYNLKWDTIFNATKFTIHTAPIVVNVVSYGVLLRNYMKYVHNRPYSSGLDKGQLKLERIIRGRNLAIFLIIGTPVVLYLLKSNTSVIENMVDISDSGSGIEVEFNSNTNIVKNGFFIFISKINSKIPSWLKLSFKLLILVLVVLKLLGFSIIFDVLNNLYLLKKLIYFLCSVVIGYQLLNLYLIHKFSFKKVKYPEVLPDFIINWLKEFKTITSCESGIKRFKQICYIEICIYLFIMVVIGLVF
jgi:hypothetical protein